MGHVIAEWVRERVKAGRALEATVSGQRQRVLALLGQAVGLPIGEVTVIKAKRLYEAHMAHRSTATGQAPAVATHRHDRQLCEQLWRWAQRRGMVANNPWELVDGQGRTNRGRQQLRPSESARFIEQAHREALAGDALATAALCCLCLGLRAGEALGLTARDVDSPWVYVSRGKTKHAARRLRAPELLLALLVRLAQGRGPDERLIVASRQALWVKVRALCARAGVPRVCVHGLRGSWASNAVDSGVSLGEISKALGHGSLAVTLGHYVSAESAHNAQIAGFNRSISIPTG